MLAIIGLGLYDLRDLSIGALEELKRCSRVYAECYTNIVPVLDFKRLEEFINKNITILRRRDLEGEGLNRFLDQASKENVALLVPGDPFIATTHMIIKIEALRRGIEVKVFHAPSILNAVTSSTGLQIYKMGRPVTIVHPSKIYFPETPYEVLIDNLSRGLHTLFLLDLDLEKGYAMEASEALEILSKLEEKHGRNVINPSTPFIVIARATSPDEKIGVFHLGDNVNVGPPPHTVIIPGLLGPVEVEALETIVGVDRKDLEKWQAFLKSSL